MKWQPLGKSKPTPQPRDGPRLTILSAKTESEAREFRDRADHYDRKSNKGP